MARIAWIEDNYKRIGSLVKLLEKDGHTILPFDSWQTAEEQIKILRACEAIILDIILPPADENRYWGLSVLEQLRNKYDYKAPVIVCSNVQNPEVLNQLSKLGVKYILLKPARPSMLYEAVTKALAGE
jgi:CheY-like chemotaxis protein